MIRATIILFSIVLLISCGKDTVAEYEDARNQILGTWELRERIETEDVGQVNTTTERNEIITFNNDGTGNKITDFNGESQFEWIYQLSPEKVSIVSKFDTTSQGFITVGKNLNFDVLENSSVQQHWEADDNAVFLIDNITLIAPRDIKWEMIRQ